MCGIFGYAGTHKPVKFIAERIRSLEYRGYDSAGIAYLNGSANPKLYKNTGDIFSILNDIDGGVMNDPSAAGIAHTRWATHGNPSQRNSHPHEFKDFYLIHNGIIENYEQLIRRFSIRDRKSDTDSEVIGAVFECLLAAHRSEPLESTIYRLMQLLEGSYACLVMFKSHPKLIAFKHKSPLIIGIEENTQNIFFSSDVHGLGQFTGKIYQLNDQDYCVCEYPKVQFFRNKKKFTPKYLKASYAHVEEKTSDCFFVKEIYEQAHNFSEALLTHNQKSMQAAIKQLKRKPSQLKLVACGSAYHASLYAKNVFDRMQDFASEAFVASEFRYRQTPSIQHELHVFVSQSGETADTLESARLSSKQPGVRLFSITNHPINSLSRLTKVNVSMNCGTEISVAATKTFTAQLKILVMMSQILKSKKTRPDVQAFGEFFDTLPDLHRQVKEVLSRLKSYKTHIYLGKDLLLPIAMEGALKLKEIAYVHAEAFPSGELKHGPLALVDPSSLSVVLVSKDFYPEKIFNAVHEVRSRGGDVLIVTDDEAVHKQEAEHCIWVKHRLSYEWCGIPFVIPLQLIAYEIAKSKGVNIDRPRNLAKSVTVE